MQNRRQIQRNRDSVASLVRGVLFCGRQDIALRGHRESDKEAACAEEHSDSDEDELSVGSQRAACSNRGNFRELLNLMKLENAEIRARFDSLPKNANYTSKDSQNEMLHAANCLIREQILTEVNNDGGIYFWIADEARDTSCSEKMSICIRYLHGVVVKERFLGFVDLHQLDARSLTSSIVSFLEDMHLPLKNCVGQAYDGASVMSGEIAGVQTLIRQQSTFPCPYIHCHAHRLNLVLVDVAKSVEFVGATFGLFEAIYAFQSVSTLRHEKFAESQRDEARVLNIPQQSDTRWVCKYKGVTFFKSRFSNVIVALENCCMSKNGKEAAEARGLLTQFKSFDVVFVLCLFHDLLGLTNSLSMALQTSAIDVGSCARIVDATVKTLAIKRCDGYFDSIWDSAVSMANDCNICLPSMAASKRNADPPSRLEGYLLTSPMGSRNSSSSTDAKAEHRRKCFAVIDAFLSELKRRFSDNNYVFEAAIATDPRQPSFLSFELMREFADMHAVFGISTTQLKCQCEVARNMFLTRISETTSEPANVRPKPKYSNAGQIYAKLMDMAPAFPDLLKYFQLILCLPVASASAERSFSTMKRIKTYLRGTMKGERLSDLALLSIERELSGNLMNQPMLVVDRFASSNRRRLGLLLN